MNDYRIKLEEVGQRIDKVLASVIEDASRQSIQAWLKSGDIKVNGSQIKPNYKCQENDLVAWQIDTAPEKREILAEDIALDIVFEDEDIIVINKPKGMIVHPTPQTTQGTLVNALMYHTNQLSDIGGEERPGIVHRLDQDTSGLLLIAKNNDAHLNLKAQFQAHSVKRVYHAITIGNIPHANGVIKAPIGRNPKLRTQMAVVEEGKDAETHFTVLQQFKGYTHVACELKTGRTHQIRVHLKYMGYPILGDKVYVRKKNHYIDGQALFAKQLAFKHPRTEADMNFEIETPKEFQTVLDQLKY